MSGGLYLEYNFSLDAADYDPRLTNTMEQGIRIAAGIGSDIGKISMDIHRPKPVCGSAFNPQVLGQLAQVADLAAAAAPLAQEAGVRLCLENHTEAFADEVVWTVNRVNHAFVGTCVDTNNSLMVGENPLEAVQKLAPLAYTNHFSDHRIEFEPYGCRITGVATGSGDVPMKRAYQLIRANTHMRRLNLEVEFATPCDDKAEARRLEYEAVVQSIDFARQELGVAREPGDA